MKRLLVKIVLILLSKFHHLNLIIMKKHITFSIYATLFFTQLLFAQDTTKLTTATDSSDGKNAWYFEFGGASIIGVTFNYERMLSKKSSGLSVRAGAGGGIFAFFDGIDAFGALPLGLAYTFPNKPNSKEFFEFGATYTHIFSNGASVDILSPNLSWKHIAKQKGLQVKATLIPLFYSPADRMAAGPWFGFSIGKRF
jgi:hypothetical protein